MSNRLNLRKEILEKIKKIYLKDNCNVYDSEDIDEFWDTDSKYVKLAIEQARQELIKDINEKLKYRATKKDPLSSGYRKALKHIGIKINSVLGEKEEKRWLNKQ